jgi:hypothetical protein
MLVVVTAAAVAVAGVVVSSFDVVEVEVVMVAAAETVTAVDGVRRVDVYSSSAQSGDTSSHRHCSVSGDVTQSSTARLLCAHYESLPCAHAAHIDSSSDSEDSCTLFARLQTRGEVHLTWRRLRIFSSASRCIGSSEACKGSLPAGCPQRTCRSGARSLVVAVSGSGWWWQWLVVVVIVVGGGGGGGGDGGGRGRGEW